MDKRVKKNKYDPTGENLKRGKKAENAFKEILKKHGFNPIPSTEQEDINEHWDFKIKKKGKEYKIDVKSMKKIGRKDEEVQDRWHWIELHGVRKNDKGWLYGGKADFIAFETKESFLIVRRLNFANICLGGANVPEKMENSNKFS